MERRPNRRFPLPIVTALLLAGATAQQKGPAGTPPSEAQTDPQIAQLLVAFARTAESNKMPARARVAFEQVLDYYDTDNSPARAALGWKRVQGEWQQAAPPASLAADAPTPAQRKQVESAWAAASKRIAALHRDLGIALLAADLRPRGISQLERALVYAPDDAAAHTALGHQSFEGFRGSDEQIAVVRRLRAIQAKVKELQAQEVAAEVLPASAMPAELRKTGIAFAGARSKHFEHWYADEPAAAVASVQLAERALALLEFLVDETGEQKKLLRPDAIRWWVVLREPEQVQRLLDVAPAATGSLTRAQANLVGGTAFTSQRGSAEWTVRRAPDTDRAAGHVAMRCLASRMCPGFAEGFTHAVTWWLCGSLDSKYATLPRTVAGKQENEEEFDPKKLMARLRAEIDAGTECTLLDLVRLRWDNFREPSRRKAWTFMVWLVARHPDRWLQLGTELEVERIQPEQVAATFGKVLEREPGAVEAEWRDWARAGAAIGKASGLPQ